jgi:hypothetical protein
LKPILVISRVMNLQGVPEANQSASEAMVYLANAWTRDGDGLFARSFNDNLRLAIRFAVKLAIGPRLAGLPAWRRLHGDASRPGRRGLAETARWPDEA